MGAKCRGDFMGTITVWTKQHKNVLDILNRRGRYTAQKEFIHQSEEAMLVINSYDWLVEHHPDRKNKPADGDYPVWVSPRQDATMLLSPDTVILELAVPEEKITWLNIIKWTMVNNYEYIPADEKDLSFHKQKLREYGVSDPKACMTQFYPELKREIQDSWNRVFDDSVKVGSDLAYGLVWELHKEWLQTVIS